MVSEILGSASTERARAFIEAQGLQFEPGFDDLVGIFEGGALVAQRNVGQVPGAVIEVTEPRVGWAAVKRRVRAVRYLYDRDRGLFEQRLALGGL